MTHVSAAENAATEAWLAGLNGMAGTFEMGPVDYEGPHGAISTDPVVAVAANARAQALVLQLARAGDRALPGDYLKRARFARDPVSTCCPSAPPRTARKARAGRSTGCRRIRASAVSMCCGSGGSPQATGLCSPLRRSGNWWR
ncbi:hypothetical protein [Rhodovulum sulfidophilum]|uniref:Uncharacterized protein n=1 Tax=Rhodovulum sulfidophilum TaxID=35806 RepID=A0ABS1RY40_RHOSU|nr:hypothetical protein [Rhodovulum sulfidophilum]MBL3611010.1 hypothetical protein [Rhodovulum sulfidophilum]